MKSRAASLLFIICALLSLALHFFLFEMRYVWYVSPKDYWLLTGGYMLCALVIVACWAMFPSRLMVALIGMLGLLFPHFYYAANERPLLGREIDASTIGVALLSVALLVGATQLRRWSKASK